MRCHNDNVATNHRMTNVAGAAEYSDMASACDADDNGCKYSKSSSLLQKQYASHGHQAPSLRMHNFILVKDKEPGI